MNIPVDFQWSCAIRIIWWTFFLFIIVFLPTKFSNQHSRSLLLALTQRGRNLGTLKINKLGHLELLMNLVTWNLFKNRGDIAREVEGEYIWTGITGIDNASGQ